MPEASTIEVGASASDGTLRYWKAKEAVRQGELRLGAQGTIRTAQEARATAITGWATATLLALAAAIAAATDWAARIGAATAASLLFIAAALCIHAARPQRWAVPGYDPTAILDEKLETELEILEATAYGISPVSQENNRRLERMATALRWAGWMLIGAPLAGATAFAVVSAVRPGP